MSNLENMYKEKLQIKNSRGQFIVIRPGGNDTALFYGTIDDPIKRKLLNDQIMKFYPNVEQVGFISIGDQAGLNMAGGEFCGNATRSTAWLALKGKPGQIEIKVSGVAGKLKAGVTTQGEAFSQMPIYANPNKICRDKKDLEIYIVEMEGITHLVAFNKYIQNLTEEDLKIRAWDLIKERSLDKNPAAGVIYATKIADGWKIDPVVFVRDINTLFYETACGSGTTALGMVLAISQGKSISKASIIQPSGLPIEISVEYNGERFGYAQISGPVESLAIGRLETIDGLSYIIEQIVNPRQLSLAFSKLELAKLYKAIFAAPPYFEDFTDQEIQLMFKDYFSQGILFLARNYDKVIGFGAAVPLLQEIEISKLAFQNGIDLKSTWYMADLGVDYLFRRIGIAQNLVQARLDALPTGVTALMRTTELNIASQTLYQKLGFKIVEGMTQDVKQTRTDGTIKTDRRIFLSKRL